MKNKFIALVLSLMLLMTIVVIAEPTHPTFGTFVNAGDILKAIPIRHDVFDGSCSCVDGQHVRKLNPPRLLF